MNEQCELRPQHMLGRRNFLVLAGGVGLAGFGIGLPAWATETAAGLTPMTTAAKPITVAERQARIAKAQRLMKAQGLSAVLIEAGSSLDYFTGIKWWRSERLTAAVIPVEGDVLIITPAFEEPSIRESLAVSGDVRVWQEDESPTALIAAFLKSRGLSKGPIGIEETVRFFAIDALRLAMPGAVIVSGAAVVRGCRMIKSSAEIALMQIASDIQIAAFRHIVPRIAKGMSQDDIGAMLVATSRALGGQTDGGLILIGESSAYPHGSDKPQRVADGQVILLDAGVSVHGYQSDISRTLVFGNATKKQHNVFGHVRRGQEVAIKAAQIGAEAGTVDDAVRQYYQTLGYGPGYMLPGTSHRTGHGIGMDGHEPVNLVHGEVTKLAAGMCFSNEPGIYIPGEFGIRLEDCFTMTAQGPRYFSQPPASLEQPV